MEPKGWYWPVMPCVCQCKWLPNTHFWWGRFGAWTWHEDWKTSSSQGNVHVSLFVFMCMHICHLSFCRYTIVMHHSISSPYFVPPCILGVFCASCFLLTSHLESCSGTAVLIPLDSGLQKQGHDVLYRKCLDMFLFLVLFCSWWKCSEVLMFTCNSTWTHLMH